MRELTGSDPEPAEVKAAIDWAADQIDKATIEHENELRDDHTTEDTEDLTDDLPGLQPLVPPEEQAGEPLYELDKVPVETAAELDLSVDHLTLPCGIGVEIPCRDPITTINRARANFRHLYHNKPLSPTINKHGLPIVLDGAVVGLCCHLDQQAGAVACDLASNVNLAACTFVFADDCSHILAKQKE